MIKSLKDGLANILPFPSNTINELDKKVISLISAINKAINAFTPKTKLCPRLVPGFDKKYKDAQMKARKFKNI